VKRLRLITLPSLVVRVGDPSQGRPLPPSLPPPPCIHASMHGSKRKRNLFECFFLADLQN
jgi:hypothetical protein